MLVAIPVQALAPLDAGARLERSLRVVDAGMDHFRVARTGMGADRILGLQDHDFAPGERERARDREADHARSDHHALDAIHGRYPCTTFLNSVRSATNEQAPNNAMAYAIGRTV